MSNKEVEVKTDGSLGCLFFIGAVIVAICLGTLYGQVYGWLFLGASLMSVAGLVALLLVMAAISAAKRKTRT